MPHKRQRRRTGLCGLLLSGTALLSASIALQMVESAAGGGSARAASTWVGASGSFSNGFNWSTGVVPGTGDDAAVASGAPEVDVDSAVKTLDVSGGALSVNGGDLAVSNGTTLAVGTIDVSTGRTLQSDVTMSSGTLTNAGTISGQLVHQGGTVNNAGAIGALVNGADTFSNNAGGRVLGATVITGGTVANSADLSSVDNRPGGTFVNNAAGSAGAVSNAGSAVNAGIVASLDNTGGTFVNNGTGTVAGTTIISGGAVTNNATLGAVDNQAGGTLTNNSGATTGALSNAGTAANAGTVASLNNSAGSFTNNAGGSVAGATVISGGTVTNNATLGTVDNQTGGILTNNTGAATGTVSNAGTASNAGSIASLANSAGSFTNNAGGSVAGATVISGGTVTNNATLASVDNRAGGTLTNNTGATAGAVSNAGNAANAGTVASLSNTAGSFANNAGGSVSGATLIAGGTVTNNAALAAVTNQAGGTLVNNAAGATGALSNAGTASNAGSVAALTSLAGSFTNNAGGVVAGATTIAGGTVTNNAALGSVDNQAGGTLVNNATGTTGAVTNAGTASSSGAIASLLNSGGSFTNLSGGVVSGSAVVIGGTFANDGSVLGAIEVYTGGLLQGVGSVGTLVVASGGTLQPGSSTDPVSTLTVTGNLSFAGGSSYVVSADRVSADLISVAGTTTIGGGTVTLQGRLVPLTAYTILTSTGGVAGRFDAASDAGLAFLTPVLSYDASNVFLTLARNGVAFADIGTTANQRSTGAAIGSLAASDEIFETVLALDAVTARSAYDQLSGDIHASEKSLLLDDSHFVRDAIAAHWTSRPDEADDGMDWWAQGLGAWGHVDGDGNAARLSRDLTGVMLGGDAAVAENWRLGVAGGYTHHDFDTASASGDAESYHAAVYGDAQWGALSLRTGAAYSWHDLSTGRSVSFDTFSDDLAATQNARTAQVFGELAYDIKLEQGTLQPFVNLAYVNLDSDGLRERGGAAALNVAGSNDDATFSVLGLRFSQDLQLGGLPVQLRGMLGWRHAYGDLTPSSTMRFASGNAFTIDGLPIAGNAALVEAGLDFALSPSARLSLSYGGEFGGGLSSQSAGMFLNIRF